MANQNFTLENAIDFYKTLANIIGDKYNIQITPKVISKNKWKYYKTLEIIF